MTDKVIVFRNGEIADRAFIGLRPASTFASDSEWEAHARLLIGERGDNARLVASERHRHMTACIPPRGRGYMSNLKM